MTRARLTDQRIHRTVQPPKPIYSVRVGRGYRAVGIREVEEVIWLWIVSHVAYDQLLARL